MSVYCFHWSSYETGQLKISRQTSNDSSWKIISDNKRNLWLNFIENKNSIIFLSSFQVLQYLKEKTWGLLFEVTWKSFVFQIEKLRTYRSMKFDVKHLKKFKLIYVSFMFSFFKYFGIRFVAQMFNSLNWHRSSCTWKFLQVQKDVCFFLSSFLSCKKTQSGLFFFRR